MNGFAGFIGTKLLLTDHLGYTLIRSAVLLMTWAKVAQPTRIVAVLMRAKETEPTQKTPIIFPMLLDNETALVATTEMFFPGDLKNETALADVAEIDLFTVPNLVTADEQVSEINFATRFEMAATDVVQVTATA